MAVVVTDTRTVRTEADTTTGITGAAGTTTSDFAEATAAVQTSLNIATGQIYHTGAAVNLSNTMVYVYTFNNALKAGWDAASPPQALHLGDGTNRISFRMAGGDRDVFKHPIGPVNWQCLLLDGSQASAMNSAGLTTARAGNFASLNLSAITQMGGDFTTLSKALAGGYNVALDIIRFGNGGIVITGGTTGDRGRFSEIAAEDRSTANLKAHGIIREFITGAFGVQGPLTFGAATGTSWFQDSGVVVSYENRNVGNDKYFFNVVGGTGATHFILRNSTLSTAGPEVTCDFSSNNIDTLEISGCSFVNLGRTITFGTDTAAEAHDVIGNTFSACGRISPGAVEFRNNVISNSTDSGGALFLTNTSQMSDITLNSGGTGHGILITSPGTYTLTRFTFNGYGADGSTDAAVYNNSGGAVTLNLSGGGTGISVRNGASATTDIQNVQTFTLTGLVPNTEVRVYRKSDGVELAGVENSGTTFSFDYNYTGDVPVDVFIHNIEYVWIGIESTLTANGVTIPIQQRFDRNYVNPD